MREQQPGVSETRIAAGTDPLTGRTVIAAAREVDHPADVSPIYQDDVEATIAAKNNSAYRVAVKRLDPIATLMAAARQPEAFTPDVAKVRARHKPKRNLKMLFDERGW